MAKSKRKRAPTAPSAAIPPAPAHAQASKIGFAGFRVVSVVFQELQKQALAEGQQPAPDGGYSMELSVNVGVGISEGKIGEVRLFVGVTPDPKVKPYAIAVDVVGRFVNVDATTEQLEHFCKEVGPTVLFPYVRMLINQLTTDGAYGAVRLQPINLNSFLGEQPWQLEQQKVPQASPT